VDAGSEEPEGGEEPGYPASFALTEEAAATPAVAEAAEDSLTTDEDDDVEEEEEEVDAAGNALAECFEPLLRWWMRDPVSFAPAVAGKVAVWGEAVFRKIAAVLAAAAAEAAAAAAAAAAATAASAFAAGEEMALAVSVASSEVLAPAGPRPPAACEWEPDPPSPTPAAPAVTAVEAEERLAPLNFLATTSTPEVLAAAAADRREETLDLAPAKLLDSET
jgi:hypothetical protein